MYSNIQLASKLSCGCDYALFKVSSAFLPLRPRGADSSQGFGDGAQPLSETRMAAQKLGQSIRPQLHLEGQGRGKRGPTFLAWLLN